MKDKWTKLREWFRDEWPWTTMIGAICQKMDELEQQEIEMSKHWPDMGEVNDATDERLKEWYKHLPQPVTLEQREIMAAIQRRLGIPTPETPGFHRQQAEAAMPKDRQFDLESKPPGSHEEESE